MPRTKWKRPDIVGGRKLSCVARAFSIMRLALNYKSGLPEEWDGKDDGLDWDGVEQLAWLSFPKHHVLSVRTNSHGCFNNLCGDDYLVAWSYKDVNDDEAHMVIGSPYMFGDMQLYGIIAVSIERRWK